MRGSGASYVVISHKDRERSDTERHKDREKDGRERKGERERY